MRNNRIKIRIAITAIALLIAGAAKAQLHVPPVFGTDSLSTRLDEIARLYIPPKKIMWISNDSLVKDAKVLLLPGTGQTELGKRNMCSLHTTESDTASILLDYGRELHGGLKLVLGSSKPWKPSSVRIRFGESVSEVCSQHDGGKRASVNAPFSYPNNSLSNNVSGILPKSIGTYISFLRGDCSYT